MTLPRVALDPVMSQTFMSRKKLAKLPCLGARVKRFFITNNRSSKSQHPTSREILITKSQSRARLWFEPSRFHWSLDIGSWSFSPWLNAPVFFAVKFSSHHRQSRLQDCNRT